MHSAGWSLYRRRNGMMRNSSIKHRHPNCAYLEVESVGAKESLLWKQALCQQESQTEREKKRHGERDAGHIWKQEEHNGGQNVLTDWTTAHGRRAERAVFHFLQVTRGKKLTDMYRNDKSLKGASVVCSRRAVLPRLMLSLQTYFKIFMEWQNFFPFCLEHFSKLHKTYRPGAWLHWSLPPPTSLSLSLSPLWHIVLPACTGLELQECRCLSIFTSVGARGVFLHMVGARSEWRHSSCCLRASRRLSLFLSLAEFIELVPSSEPSTPPHPPPPWRPSLPPLLHFIFYCQSLSQPSTVLFHCTDFAAFIVFTPLFHYLSEPCMQKQ